PGEQRRGRALDRQQQRRGGGGRARKPEHQQHRSGDAAQGDGAGEPSIISARERGLPRGGGGPGRARERAQQRDADAGAAVEQAGQNHGVHDPEQRLGRGRGHAEQGGRCERGKDSGGIHRSAFRKRGSVNVRSAAATEPASAAFSVGRFGGRPV